MKLPQEILDKIFLYSDKEDVSGWFWHITELRNDIYYIKQSSLELASWYGSIFAVKYLLKESSKLNKEIALIISSMMGHLNIVKFLIENGVEPSEDCIILCNNEDIKNYILNLKN